MNLVGELVAEIFWHAITPKWGIAIPHPDEYIYILAGLLFGLVVLSVWAVIIYTK